jgi:non-heme chloroperoxidase
MSAAPKLEYWRLIAALAFLAACGAGATAATDPEGGQRDGPRENLDPQAGNRAGPGAAPIRSDEILGGGGVKLTLYETGTAGAPSIILIHGFTQNYLTWERQLASLGDRFHTVTFDMRGHGASEKPLDAASYTDPSLWADDVAAVIRERSLRRPVLVGWSYGGYVISDYLRRYGDQQLGGLVFVDAVTKNGTAEAQGYFTDHALAMFGDVLSADVRASLAGTRSLTRMFARRDRQTWEVAFGSAMMVPPPVRIAMFSRLLDNDDVLSQVSVPTLVLHGGADDIVRVGAAEQIARTIPGARLRVYEGVGHAPHLDAVDRFNRDLAEFVRSVH